VVVSFVEGYWLRRIAAEGGRSKRGQRSHDFGHNFRGEQLWRTGTRTPSIRVTLLKEKLC
jgi:hypothetical protein